MKERFGALLRAWYEVNRRDLRWRKTRDPYLIWLSETILQQTRVQQGAAYYDSFVEAFPSVADLAAADEDQVLKLWQGLGYYSRARNLHRAARQIVELHAGRFPDRYEEVRALPGVGPYTAAAILSIALDQPYATVDGNVYRLYARLFDMEQPIDTPAGQRAFAALADELLDRQNPGLFNQALMEFGALHCTPHAPRCEECPFADFCQAHLAATVSLRPCKRGHQRLRDRYLHYLHLSVEGRVPIRRREGRDIWQGLYELPLVETSEPRLFEELELPTWLADRTFHLKGVVDMPPHLLSHQRLHARFYRLEVAEVFPIEGFRLVAEESLDTYAWPRLIDRYLQGVRK